MPAFLIVSTKKPLIYGAMFVMYQIYLLFLPIISSSSSSASMSVSMAIYPSVYVIGKRFPFRFSFIKFPSLFADLIIPYVI